MKSFQFLWRNIGTRIWLVVTSVIIALILTITLVVTQNMFIYETIVSISDGGSRVLLSGDPSQYQYYQPDEGLTDKASVLRAANLLNETIVEEGAVLLKNEGSLPLQKQSKISVFGKNSVNLVYGGSGSAGSAAGGAVTLEQSLQSAGFTVNPVLTDFYKTDRASGTSRPAKGPSMGQTLTGYPTFETSYDAYTDQVKASYRDYNDAAIVVISRIGGEGFDLPRTMYWNGKKYDNWSEKAEKQLIPGAESMDSHYLQLDANEKRLIEEVGKQFQNVVLLINSGAPLELGMLDDVNSVVDGALWIGTTGKTGINAVGRILNGDVNPSGRTVDTYARDFKQDPSWFNVSNNRRNNGNRYKVDSTEKSYYYVDYEEGIYVGYRYWETRGYTEAQAGNREWYQNHVVYPFGYGLSYTQFDWEIVTERTTENESVLSKDSTIEVTVKVTNVGNVAGKDVVQLYYTAPYYGTKQHPGIEKSQVVLLDFGKTELLNPGESDELTFTWNPIDMASYDYNDANGNEFIGYETEEGDYGISVARNAHESVLGLNYQVPAGGFQYRENKLGNAVENRFDDVSGHIETYLSRSDWEGTMPTTPTDEDRTVTKEFIDSLVYRVDDTDKPWYTDVMPTQSKKTQNFHTTTIKLYELIGAEYNDERWDELLNQLTVSEMVEMIGTGNYNTMEILGIGKPRTIDLDGPVGFTAFMGAVSVYDTCFYASGCVIAASYNKELAYQMGRMVGNEGLIGNEQGDGTPYSGWYAPAVNIHRSQFSGRNWEYYSEDCVLSGKIAAGVIQGTKSKGVYTYLKHFALNDQETDRTSNGILTWANEQAMREIYLKAFEVAVTEGQTTAVMSSFNRIGTVWAGGSYPLLTEVLRNEWNFCGMVITDYNLYSHMPADQMIRAGGDLNLTQQGLPSSDAKSLTATHVQALRTATKNILYTVVNSNAMNGYGEGVEYGYTMPQWEVALLLVDAAIVVCLAAWGIGIITVTAKRKGGKPKKNV